MGTTEYWDIYLDYILCKVSYKCYGVLQWHEDNYINYICQLTLYFGQELQTLGQIFCQVADVYILISTVSSNCISARQYQPAWLIDLILVPTTKDSPSNCHQMTGFPKLSHFTHKSVLKVSAVQLVELQDPIDNMY